MNRGLAILLAMVAMLAHTLAIYLDEARHFAPPYDFAHVAFRVARNFVREGSFVFNTAPLEGGFGSYPSPLWILVATVSEGFYWPVTLFCQMVGILAVLTTVGLSARFAAERFSGVITPVLLVSSGGMAAAAASGTETPLVVMLLTGCFAAFEFRWRTAFAILLSLLVAARPEGVVIAIAFFLLHLIRRVASTHQRPFSAPLFLPALVVTVGLFQIELSGGRSLYGSLLGSLMHPDPTRVQWGVRYLWDFVLSTVTPLLLAIPLAFIALRKLSGLGVRAFLLALVWAAIVIAQGGGRQPFSEAMAPAVPLIFLAVQEGMTAALDSKSRLLEASTWILLVATLVLSSLASKFPGDLGPLRTYELHQMWMTGSAPTPYRTDPVLGRLALDEQIQRTGELRDLGIFLRREEDSGRSLLTPWPGAVGYLSGMRVLDLFGRTTAPEGITGNPPWSTRCRIDVVAALGQEPDYILPALISAREIGKARFEVHFARELARLDSDIDPHRVRAISESLAAYEWMTLHVPFREGRASQGGSSRPLYMMRRRDLGLAPRIEVTRDEEFLTVRATAVATLPLPAVSQVVHLQIAADDDLDRTFYLNPSGTLVADGRVCTRTGLLLDAGLEVDIELARLRLEDPPSGAHWKRVRCRLLNPGMRVKHPLAVVGEQVELDLRH